MKMMKNNITYDEFVKKWANRPLYETPYDYFSSSAGKIQMYRDENYKLDHLRNCKIIVDVFITPKSLGWKDEKQRLEFYKDAKKVGLSVNKSTRNEWYKTINIIELI
jgi:hypothetical protein